MTNTLADRLEQAEKPCRELDHEIWEAMGWTYRIPDSLKFHYWFDPLGNRKDPPGSPTSSLDAAMTLVPEGWIVSIRRSFNSDGEFVSTVKLTNSFSVDRGCDPDEEVSVGASLVEPIQHIDPTPLALSAASMRARGK